MPKNLARVVLVGLATFRLTYAILIEDGPMDIFIKFREYILTRYNETHWINKGFSCPFCVSFWVALVLTTLPSIVSEWLASAEVTRLLFKRELG